MTHSFQQQSSFFASIFVTSLAITAAACTSSGSSGGGKLTVSWSIEHVDGSPAPCQAGFDTMQITTDGFRADGVELADPQTVTFACAAGTGVIDLPGGGENGGTYSVIWEETDTAGDVFMTDAISQTNQSPIMVDVAGGAAAIGTTLYVEGGWAWVEWNLFGTQADTGISTCSAAGVDRVDLVFTDTASSATTTVRAACPDVASNLALSTMNGVGSLIHPLAAGSYTLLATAYASGQVVGMSDGTDSVGIESPNKISLFPDTPSIQLTNR